MALLALLALLATGAQAATRTAAVVFVAGQPKIIVGGTQGCAVASYEDADDHPSHFGVLRVSSNGSACGDVAGYTQSSRDKSKQHQQRTISDSDDVDVDARQMYAAGIAEAYLTASEIQDMYRNMLGIFTTLPKGVPPANLSLFLAAQTAWQQEQIAAHPGDLYWRQLALVQGQMQGLVDGYAMARAEGQAYFMHKAKANNRSTRKQRPAAAPAPAAATQQLQPLDAFAFFMLSGSGDLNDLLPAACPALRVEATRLSSAQLAEHVLRQSRCSVLVKLADDLSDIFMAHSTWFNYLSMVRMMKHYWLPTARAAATRISFSSYPGMLVSTDDFYLSNAGIAILQTTNSIFNTSLFDLVRPQSVLAYQRIRIALALAPTARDWSSIMCLHNSGTYNNQYIALDLKLFTPGEPLDEDLLWVTEQIPGMMVSRRQTETLERGYWPSYNVPFFPEIYEASGYPTVVAQHGTSYSYDLCPRAEIFRRDQSTVHDIDSLNAVMRSNSYKTDPLAHGSPLSAICSRGDLTGGAHTQPLDVGCTDTKSTSFSIATQLQSYAVNGPTTAGNTLPPFRWSTEFANVSHWGQPDVFDFVFELQDPAWPEEGEEA